MADGIYSALSGAVAQERALEMIANNVANVSTNGFKGQKIVFREARVGADADPTHRQVVIDAVVPDFSQGAIRQTGNVLDLALEGPGFFVVSPAEGDFLTRNGAFVRNAQGVLSTLDGAPVMGANGSIALPIDAQIEIDGRGIVWDRNEQVGQVRVVEVPPENLRRVSSNRWELTDDGSMERASRVKIVSGAVERSNVNAIGGMLDLVRVTRAHEAFHKGLEMFRSIDRKSSNEMT